MQTKIKMYLSIILYLQITMKLFSSSPCSKENNVNYFLIEHRYFPVSQHGELNTTYLIVIVEPS